MSRSPKREWPRCPKCRSQQVELIEIWDAAISWHPGDPYYNEGVLEPGDAKKVEGHCLDCTHRWTLRGVIQVREEWFADES